MTAPWNRCKLKPLFEGGVVTAGNASGVNDGAAALLIGSKHGASRNKKPIARILSAASAGVEPRIMGVGPAYAIPKALERAKLQLRTWTSSRSTRRSRARCSAA